MWRCWRVWLMVCLAVCVPLSASAAAWACHGMGTHTAPANGPSAPPACHDADGATAPDQQPTSTQLPPAHGTHCLGCTCACPGSSWGLNTLGVPPAVPLGPLRPAPWPTHRPDSPVLAGLERPPRAA